MVNDLFFTPATELRRLIDNKQVSVVELTEMFYRRIEDLNPKLNAYLALCPDQAMEQAHTAQDAVQRSDFLGPLHGIPIAYKDLIYTAGVATTCASTILKEFVPNYDAAVVERLRGAGAITLGKLNLTEFALYGYHPDLKYPKNPWNVEHWAGVSSSGSGAATAASLCYASLGTDTGGSIRFPAAACGIVGLKATFGKISRYGVFPLSDTLDHIGPMTRSVWDAAAMLQILAGRDPRDAATRIDPEIDYLKAMSEDPSGLHE